VQYGITGEGSMPQKTGVALTSRNYDRGDADGDGN